MFINIIIKKVNLILKNDENITYFFNIFCFTFIIYKSNFFNLNYKINIYIPLIEWLNLIELHIFMTVRLINLNY
jgi:hypothetical protein